MTANSDIVQVVSPFLSYAKGAIISDPAAVAVAEGSFPGSVVRISSGGTTTTASAPVPSIVVNVGGTAVSVPLAGATYANGAVTLPSNSNTLTLPASASLLATDANGNPVKLALGSNLVSQGGLLSAAGSLSGVASLIADGTPLSSGHVAPSPNQTVQRTLAQELGDTVKPERYGAVGDGVTLGFAAALQACHDNLPAGGGTIELGTASYVWDGPVVFTKPVRMIGRGGYDGLANIIGTQLIVNSPDFFPLVVTPANGEDPRGGGVTGVSWSQPNQQYGASPFVPVDYPPCITIVNTGGGYLLGDIEFKGCSRGILLIGCGHFTFGNIFGQVWRYGLEVDACYDVGNVGILRLWTYVFNTLAIAAWCQTHSVALRVGRCDGLNIGVAFGFNQLSMAHGVMGHQDAVAPTAAVAPGATTLPVPDTSSLCAGMTVQGTGIAWGTTIASVTDATHIVLSTATVAALGTVSPLIFGCYAPEQLLRTTAQVAAGATTIPLTSTTGLWVGQNVVAEFLPLASVITGISGNSITVSLPARFVAPANAPLFFGTGFPSAFATLPAGVTNSTTLTVSGLTGNCVPNMRLVPALRGMNAGPNPVSLSTTAATASGGTTLNIPTVGLVDGQGITGAGLDPRATILSITSASALVMSYPATAAVANGEVVQVYTITRVVSATSNSVTLSTAVSLPAGAALIFQMPPALGAPGGVPQYSFTECGLDRGRFARWSDGLTGQGTQFDSYMGNFVAGGQDSSIGNGTGQPLDLAYAILKNADLGECCSTKTYHVGGYMTSAIRTGGGSNSFEKLGMGSTIGTGGDRALPTPLWPVRPLVDVEPAPLSGYSNIVSLGGFVHGAPNGCPIFDAAALAGTNAIVLYDWAREDNAGNAILRGASGSVYEQVGGSHTLTAPGGVYFKTGTGDVGLADAIYVRKTAAAIAANVGLIFQLDYAPGTGMSYLNLIQSGAANGLQINTGGALSVQGDLLEATYSYAQLTNSATPGYLNPATQPAGAQVRCYNATNGSETTGNGTGCDVETNGTAWVRIDGAALTA